MSPEALRYGSAGVDLDSAGDAKQRLKRLVESTFTKGSVGGAKAAPGATNSVGTTGTLQGAAARSVKYRSLSVLHASTAGGFRTRGSDAIQSRN